VDIKKKEEEGEDEEENTTPTHKLKPMHSHWG